MTRTTLALALMLAGCDALQRDAVASETIPEDARPTDARCAAGEFRAECDAARERLAQERRRERMDAYEKRF